MDAVQLRRRYLDVNIANGSLDRTIGAIVPCMVLAFIALAMRLASRRIKGSKFIISDYLAIGGFICAWAVGLIVIEEARIGEIQPVTISNRRKVLKISFASGMFYGTGFSLIKLSIIMLYRQLFPTRFIRVSTAILSFCVVGWGIGLVVATIFTCQPIHGFWDVDIPSKCINTKWFCVGNGIPNMITDVCLLGLPDSLLEEYMLILFVEVREVWRLQLSWRSKAAISSLFILGGFVIVASGLRIGSMLVTESSSLTWTYVDVSVWASIEINVAVMCCCFPTVRPVLAWLLPNFLKRRKPPVEMVQPEYKPKPLRIRRTTEFDLKIPETEDSFTPLQSVVTRSES
ncbi:uncharacterized protein F4807DRAFT_465010 [Annulohypoxylon truncatum]|uniref:uncharacterized protein n=1 Tax=Annulohypoxylon truncatum TaxID=327061 RepID=UPI002008ABD3|nr:uncharacterized protein F4807DRAFT_465010 [Annulohypoxylon truncatum]KAI1205041.1 hypothetical protein F4807DRAFT_465010 [Annulohypoxylon truncatum]